MSSGRIPLQLYLGVSIMKKYADHKSKMRFNNHREYENNYWHQYEALKKVKCTVEDEEERNKLYQHFIGKAFRINDALYLSSAMLAELTNYLLKEFRMEHRYG